MLPRHLPPTTRQRPPLPPPAPLGHAARRQAVLTPTAQLLPPLTHVGGPPPCHKAACGDSPTHPRTAASPHHPRTHDAFSTQTPPRLPPTPSPPPPPSMPLAACTPLMVPDMLPPPPVHRRGTSHLPQRRHPHPPTCGVSRDFCTPTPPCPHPCSATPARTSRTPASARAQLAPPSRTCGRTLHASDAPATTGAHRSFSSFA